VNLAASVTEEEEIIFFPKGEPLLDEELVNSAFTFLARRLRSDRSYLQLRLLA
jgi:hypothetical protein